MSELPIAPPPNNSRYLVYGLLVIIAIGVVVWVHLEFNADILLNREKGGKFGAEYEKRCQGTFEPKVCKRLAGLNHASCMHDAGLARVDDAQELEVYMACMLARQDASAPK